MREEARELCRDSKEMRRVTARKRHLTKRAANARNVDH